MNILKRHFIIILIFVFSSPSFGFEKVATTSFQFLKIMMSARASSMAGAFTAVVNNSEGVYWNPAGLVRVDNLDASISYAQWFFDVNHYSFSAAYDIEGIGVIGLHGIYADYGTIEVTHPSALRFVGDDYLGYTGETIRPNAVSVGVSYAKYLTENFSFGVTAKFIRENLVEAEVSSFAFDAGLIYKTGFRSVEIAATVMHFGPQIKFVDKSYPLPQTMSIGISTHLISPANPMLIENANHDLLISYDMTQPRDYDQQHSLGMEYSFENIIYLRGGYKFNSDQEGISAGLGLKWENYRMDYSFNDYGQFLNSIHKFTIGFAIK